MRLVSQTPADPIQGDLNCFGDWAINSEADAVGTAAQMGAILTRISGGLKGIFVKATLAM